MENVMNDASILAEENKDEKIHPWRLCPLGKHYVREHHERIPPSKKHPAGRLLLGMRTVLVILWVSMEKKLKTYYRLMSFEL